MIRHAYHHRQKGLAGVGDLIFYSLYFPCLALRLYFGLFVTRPFVWLRVRIMAKWIRIRRAFFFARARRLRKDKNSPLEQALARAVCSRNVHNISILLARGANPSGRLRTNSPFLLIAVRARQYEIAQLLLDAGADVNARDPASGVPAIWFTAYNNDLMMLQILLDHGADTNACGITQHTTLMEAARAGNAEMVRILLAHGADASKRDLNNWTARSWAENKHKEEIVKLLVEHRTLKVGTKDSIRPY